VPGKLYKGTRILSGTLLNLKYKLRSGCEMASYGMNLLPGFMKIGPVVRRGY
jgi:hypothetical protein